MPFIYYNKAKKNLKALIANFMNNIIVMSEMHVAHTKPLSRKHSLSESRGGFKVTKLIFSDSVKQSAIRWDDICCLNCV